MARRKNHRPARRPHLPYHVEGISLNIGPGGTMCACCAPAPGSVTRKIILRSARRKAKARAIHDSIQGDE